MPATIIRGEQGAPGQISRINGLNLSALNEVNMVDTVDKTMLLNKYGNERYSLIAEILGKTSLEEGEAYTQTISHFEKGRIFSVGFVNANVTAIVSGAAVTFVLKSPESYTNGATGTQAPFRVKEVVKLRSNGRKARIDSITPTTGAWSVTVTPLGAYAFATGTTTTLSANDAVELVGNQLAGEAADSMGTQMSKVFRIDNTCTSIRDSAKSTDYAGMQRTQVNFGGSNYITALAIKDMNSRMFHYIEDACFEGVPDDNIAGAVGTDGVLPQVEARGSKVNYLTGSVLTAADFNRITRCIDANGGPREYHGLQQLSQRQQISTGLFGLYNNGSLSYGSVGSNSEAAVSYGFNSFNIDTVGFHFYRYKGFSAEAVYGYTPNGTTGDYRADYGLFVPQGMITDVRTGATRPQMQWVYWKHPDLPAGTKIYTWELGFSKGTKTTEASNKWEQQCWVGSRITAAEQFIIFQGVAA